MKKIYESGKWRCPIPKKLLLVMKLTAFLIIVLTMHVSATVYSQSKKLTLNMQGNSIKEVLQQIEAQSEYRFLYENEKVNLDTKVSIRVKDEVVENILKKLFGQDGISYSITENNLILINPSENQMKGIGKEPGSLQQQKPVSGKVTDSTGSPLPGVSVVVKGTTTGTISDANGNYSLSNLSVNAILQFSFVGMKTQEVAVGSKTTLNVALAEDAIGIEEVVAVGYGTQKKVNLTGSVGTINSKELEARPVQNAVQALQGKIPGLNITTRGNAGELNSGNNINIRGTGTIGAGSNASPLVLIDGMEGNLSNLNPQDIENISVLKDAAASSIYGSRAPFGVILVTTKKGKEGKVVVNYNNNFRWSTPTQVPQMANSLEFTHAYNDISANGGGAPMFNEANVKRIEDYYYGHLDPKDVMVPFTNGTGKWDYDYPNANTDWMNTYFRQWAPAQEHAASISGGGDKIKYYASTNYLDQDGLLRYGTDNYKRMSATANASVKVSEYVSVDVNTKFIRTIYDRPTMLDGGFYLNVLRRARPTRPLYDPNGRMANDINYVGVLRDGGRANDEEDWNYMQGRVNITPIKGWTIKAEFNYRTQNSFNHSDKKLIYSYLTDGVTPYRSALSVSNNSVAEFAYKSNFFSPNIYSDYENTFGKHNVKGLLGIQSENFFQRQFSASRNDMVTEEITELDKTTSATGYGISGNRADWATFGYFGRLNYDYDGRYLLEMNLRYDGTSRFREDKRWGLFPSVSAGWNVSKENFFMPISSIINFLKIRASFGSLGNQNTSLWYPTYSTVPIGMANGNWLLNGLKPNTASAPAAISSYLTWERIQSWNAGLDFGAVDNRLSGSIDYFRRYTLDMVGPAPTLPAVFGTAVPKINNTDLVTSGFELSIGWKDKIGDFSYGVQASLADSKTKITRYPNETRSIDTYRSGVETGQIWGYVTKGLARTNEEMDTHIATLPNGGQNAFAGNWKAGDIMYSDLNGDKKISAGSGTESDHGDLTVIGNSNPRYLYGLNLDFAWKGIDLSLFWQGVAKRDYMAPADNMVFWGPVGSAWWSTILTDHLDYFRTEASPLGSNTNAYFPRAMFGNQNHQPQTRYLQDASYLRLKNLQIGYTLPRAWTAKAGISSFRIFFSGENMLTYTKLRKTLDPETVGLGGNGNNTTVGTVYPLSQVFSMGLNINF